MMDDTPFDFATVTVQYGHAPVFYHRVRDARVTELLSGDEGHK
jgi:hypothetical protein